LENPLKDNFELGLMRRGVARQLGTPVVQKLPLTVPILLKIHDLLDMARPSDLSFWAACLLGFYGLLRKSTLLPKSASNVENAILRSDIVNLCADSFVLCVRHSKTIQFGQRVLQIPFFYCEIEAMCPVRTLMLLLLSSRLPSSARLFSFMVSDHVFELTHSVFVKKLRNCLSACGYDPTVYSGHSFRRGGCTLSFEAGLGVMDIKMRGDWRSNAFERYLHIPSEKIFASARAISNCVANQSRLSYL
jgi:hypothetical protein